MEGWLTKLSHDAERARQTKTILFLCKFNVNEVFKSMGNFRYILHLIVLTYQNKQRTLQICNFVVVCSHESLLTESVLDKN